MFSFKRPHKFHDDSRVNTCREGRRSSTRSLNHDPCHPPTPLHPPTNLPNAPNLYDSNSSPCQPSLLSQIPSDYVLCVNRRSMSAFMSLRAICACFFFMSECPTIERQRCTSGSDFIMSNRLQLRGSRACRHRRYICCPAGH